MSDAVPMGIRLLHALRKEPDWTAMSDRELVALRDAENRRRSSALLRVVAGFPDRAATIGWRKIALPGRELRVRAYRGDAAGELPLVVHVHGGGFVGTAVQSDWINSRLAARLPALVVSVEHRLLGPGTALAAAVGDGWDVLREVVRDAARWGVDPARVAVFGESAGGLIAALAAIRARDSGLDLRAQVLVNPCVDVTSAAFDHDSMREHATSAMLTATQMRLFLRLAVPPGADARTVSPLHVADLGGLAPALVVVPAVDPVADHGRTYVRRLREAGTAARLAEHAGAPHGFLSVPGLVPQARVARTQIVDFLRDLFYN